MLPISQASTLRTALFFGSAALTLSTLTPAANAFTLNSTTGNWSNPVGGEWVEYRTVSSENQVRWGLPGSFNPFDTNRKSGMGFLGSSTTKIAAGDIFGLGRLRHYNQPIWGGAPSQVALSLNLDLAGLGVKTFNYALNIEETTNSGTCRYYSVTPCSDRITWTNAIAAESFQVNNTEYTLELIGFSTAVGGNLVNEFISQEGGNSDAYLYAQLTALTPPEPPTPPTPLAPAPTPTPTPTPPAPTPTPTPIPITPAPQPEPEAIPEPTSILALFSALWGGAWLKRKQAE